LAQTKIYSNNQNLLKPSIKVRLIAYSVPQWNHATAPVGWTDRQRCRPSSMNQLSKIVWQWEYTPSCKSLI